MSYAAAAAAAAAQTMAGWPCDLDPSRGRAYQGAMRRRSTEGIIGVDGRGGGGRRGRRYALLYTTLCRPPRRHFRRAGAAFRTRSACSGSDRSSSPLRFSRPLSGRRAFSIPSDSTLVPGFREENPESPKFGFAPPTAFSDAPVGGGWGVGGCERRKGTRDQQVPHPPSHHLFSTAKPWTCNYVLLAMCPFTGFCPWPRTQPIS